MIPNEHSMHNLHGGIGDEFETVEIDGVHRPVRDARGRLIGHGDPEKLRSFWYWFGDSCAVDAWHRPQVAYHGTASPTFTRDGTRTEFGTRNGMGEGAYFTPDPKLANEYARMDHEVGDGDAAIIPVYLSIQNPKVFRGGIDSQSISTVQKVELLAQGYDGVFGYSSTGELVEIVAFQPTQIKSTTGNPGTYDPDDSRITDAANWDVTIRPRKRASP
jgi:hypothetical protein